MTAQCTATTLYLEAHTPVIRLHLRLMGMSSKLRMPLAHSVATKNLLCTTASTTTCQRLCVGTCATSCCSRLPCLKLSNYMAKRQCSMVLVMTQAPEAHCVGGLRERYVISPI